MKKIIALFVLFLIFSGLFLYMLWIKNTANKSSWKFQSIDTMKYSRDLSREKMKDKNFDDVIDKQIQNIAATGATHVAIATPYDEEFIPMLKRWVAAARKYHLKVWFRGNFSGWEKWFGYSGIEREEHKRLTKNFILSNKDLFQNGDIFTACPECENGGPGDPRITGDITGHRNFLIEEHKIADESFKSINVNVDTTINSMNADVARLIMDPTTTQALGGIVAIDHYVRSPEQLVSDIKGIARNSQGKVVLGEMGAPIPDINGQLSDEQQAKWISTAFSELASTSELVGINYWVNVGGTTELWDSNGRPKTAVGVIRGYYHAQR